MIKTKKITVFSDSGHAWAKVKRSELVSLLVLGKISSYSYQRSEYVYLEEDCDLSHYINALKLNNPDLVIVWNTRNTNSRSKIRSYERFYSPIKTFKEGDNVIN